MDRLDHHRAEVRRVLDQYQATSPHLFGSVARGNADNDSDLDILVTIDPTRINPLMAVSGLSDELSTLLGMPVDVVTEPLLRDGVARSAIQDMVPL